VRWHIENVTAAYLDGGEFKRLGVTGPLGSHDVCPSTTTLYTLRVDTAGGPIERAITVFVSLDQAPGQEQTITINGTGGSVREDGVLLPQAMAGDDDHDRALRAFMAFDVSGLAGARIVEARLELINSTQVGSPFTSLGGLYLEEVAWGPSLSATDYARPAMLSLRNLSSPAYLRVAMDVADSLAQYTAGGRDRFGLRLRFEKGSNGNRAEDYVSWAGARLTVRFAR
jgi:hypothetical protein